MLDDYILTRPDRSEVQQRLQKIHEYCIEHPAAKPRDLRLELMETTHLIHRYFKLAKAGEFNVN